MAKNDPTITIERRYTGPWLRLNEHETGHEATYYSDLGKVEIFTHDGTAHRCPAFTTLKLFYNGAEYSWKLDRAYHPRWFGRMASNLAHAVWNEEKKYK